MSALDTETTSPGGGTMDQPSFPLVLRGYDRQQVHAHIEELRGRLGSERSRAEQAERAVARMQAELDGARNQAPPSFEHLGSEAARVLEQAGHSATLLLDEARSRGRGIVEEAEAEAADVIQQAEQRAAKLEEAAAGSLNEAAAERDRMLTLAAQEAEDVRVQVEHEARTALADARDEAARVQHRALSERAAMETETERLRESRDRMVEFLSRIHADLGTVLAETVRPDEVLGVEQIGLEEGMHLDTVAEAEEEEAEEEEEEVIMHHYLEAGTEHQ